MHVVAIALVVLFAAQQPPAPPTPGPEHKLLTADAGTWDAVVEMAEPGKPPMKSKGVGELGLCGVAAAIANAVYNATGVRVRDYPVTLDKLLAGLPAQA